MKKTNLIRVEVLQFAGETGLRRPGTFMQLPKEKAMLYAYRDRRNKKRTFRALWITRINAGARMHGMSYSQFMGKVKANNIELNRKVLADLAMNHPDAFKAIVEKVK